MVGCGSQSLRSQSPNLILFSGTCVLMSCLRSVPNLHAQSESQSAQDVLQLPNVSPSLSSCEWCSVGTEGDQCGGLCSRNSQSKHCSSPLSQDRRRERSLVPRPRYGTMREEPQEQRCGHILSLSGNHLFGTVEAQAAVTLTSRSVPAVSGFVC
jgi:hypothetical protein